MFYKFFFIRKLRFGQQLRTSKDHSQGWSYFAKEHVKTLRQHTVLNSFDLTRVGWVLFNTLEKCKISRF